VSIETNSEQTVAPEPKPASRRALLRLPPPFSPPPPPFPLQIDRTGDYVLRRMSLNDIACCGKTLPPPSLHPPPPFPPPPLHAEEQNNDESGIRRATQADFCFLSLDYLNTAKAVWVCFLPFFSFSLLGLLRHYQHSEAKISKNFYRGDAKPPLPSPPLLPLPSLFSLSQFTRTGPAEFQ